MIFAKSFYPNGIREQLTCGERQRRRSASLSVSEIMTVVIHLTTVISRAII
ncbi:hypothetical protein NOC27_1706 [Nitrosococcus oceani AFC27]|nr:hypothetical protein NOC27_1706 [Nitrosococcus oceani AFC27]